MEFIQNNPGLSFIIAAVLLWFLLRKNGLFEGFMSCYNNKTVLLNDVTGSSSEGVVDLEKHNERLFISLNANVPYHKGGVFGTTVSNYNAYLIDKNTNLPPIVIGPLLRYGDRRYRLKNELLGTYDKYTHIIVSRHTLNEDYPDVIVLEGKL